MVCMPVAFCVFWWDSPLSAWNPGSVFAGSRVLACNVLLSIAFIASYRSMFALRAKPRAQGAPAVQQLLLAARLLFGAWMLVNGANHFFFSLWPMPTGQNPLAVELMGAFLHSHLLDVAMLIELVTGALILAGFFVPAALCVVMPVSTCALYWSVLDHQPLSLLFGLAAFALNGLLMLAHLEYYQGALQRTALTLGESAQHDLGYSVRAPSRPHFARPVHRRLDPARLRRMVVREIRAEYVRPMGPVGTGVSRGCPACPAPARHGPHGLVAAGPRSPDGSGHGHLGAPPQPGSSARLRRPAGRAPRVRRLRSVGLHWQGAGGGQQFRTAGGGLGNGAALTA